MFMVLLYGVKSISTSKLRDNPKATSKAVTYAAREWSFHNVNRIKGNHKNIETETPYMSALLMPHFTTTVVDMLALLLRHVSKHNLELWTWKCSDNEMIRYIQSCYNPVTSNYIILNKIIPNHPRGKIGIMMKIWYK